MVRHHVDGKWQKYFFCAVACTKVRFYYTNGQNIFVADINYKKLSNVVFTYMHGALASIIRTGFHWFPFKTKQIVLQKSEFEHAAHADHPAYVPLRDITVKR